MRRSSPIPRPGGRSVPSHPPPATAASPPQILAEAPNTRPAGGFRGCKKELVSSAPRGQSSLASWHAARNALEPDPLAGARSSPAPPALRCAAKTAPAASMPKRATSGPSSDLPKLPALAWALARRLPTICDVWHQADLAMFNVITRYGVKHRIGAGIGPGPGADIARLSSLGRLRFGPPARDALGQESRPKWIRPRAILGSISERTCPRRSPSGSKWASANPTTHAGLSALDRRAFPVAARA